MKHHVKSCKVQIQFLICVLSGFKIISLNTTDEHYCKEICLNMKKIFFDFLKSVFVLMNRIKKKKKSLNLGLELNVTHLAEESSRLYTSACIVDLSYFLGLLKLDMVRRHET